MDFVSENTLPSSAATSDASEIPASTDFQMTTLNLLDLSGFEQATSNSSPPDAETFFVCLDGEDRREETEEKPKEAQKNVKDDLATDIPAEADLRDGDIIFISSSRFDEARAIQALSNSPLTHCGVLFKEGKDWFVYEAGQKVCKTPLSDFHDAKNGDTYLVMRLADPAKLDANALNKMKTYLQGNLGKPYDHVFGWGDDQMYCSELVWKAYDEAAGLKVGDLKQIQDFDLSNPIVKKQLEARYGGKVPLKETTIAPGGIYDSSLLQTIKKKP